MSTVSLVIMSTKDIAIAVRSVAWRVKARVKEKQNRKSQAYRKRMMFNLCYRQETDQGISKMIGSEESSLGLGVYLP